MLEEGYRERAPDAMPAGYHSMPLTLFSCATGYARALRRADFGTGRARGTRIHVKSTVNGVGCHGRLVRQCEWPNNAGCHARIGQQGGHVPGKHGLAAPKVILPTITFGITCGRRSPLAERLSCGKPRRKRTSRGETRDRLHTNYRVRKFVITIGDRPSGGTDILVDAAPTVV